MYMKYLILRITKKVGTFFIKYPIVNWKYSNLVNMRLSNLYLITNILKLFFYY